MFSLDNASADANHRTFEPPTPPYPPRSGAWRDAAAAVEELSSSPHQRVCRQQTLDLLAPVDKWSTEAWPAQQARTANRSRRAPRPGAVRKGLRHSNLQLQLAMPESGIPRPELLHKTRTIVSGRGSNTGHIHLISSSKCQAFLCTVHDARTWYTLLHTKARANEYSRRKASMRRDEQLLNYN